VGRVVEVNTTFLKIVFEKHYKLILTDFGKHQRRGGRRWRQY